MADLDSEAIARRTPLRALASIPGRVRAFGSWILNRVRSEPSDRELSKALAWIYASRERLPGSRERVETESRERIERAILETRLVFDGGPYEAHVCFDNFCNMSCIMCWNGANPPRRQMPSELIERFEHEVAPLLSVMVPYDGSEPLIAGWSETRRIAKTHGIELCLTTNVEFLDERRFHELKDITETLYLSADSHHPDVLGEIRPGSRPERVLANLRSAAALAEQFGVECQANVVLLAQNAPHLAATIEYMADAGIPAVHVIQMLDVNGECEAWNPLVRFPAEQIASIKQDCIDTARRKAIRLVWDVRDLEDHDFRAVKVPPTPRKSAYDHWEWRMKHLAPGFCRFVRDRLRISVDGSVAPCSFSTDGELELGRLGETEFARIWNGAKLRDLRRAHLTGDYPAICKACRFADPPPPETELPFAHDYIRDVGGDPATLPKDIKILEPSHMFRARVAPTIRIARPDRPENELTLLMALGGEIAHLQAHSLEPIERSEGRVRLRMPPETWKDLRANLGYWWTIVERVAGTGKPVARASEIPCWIRHRPLRRIPKSDLRYTDQGHLPVVDLGGARDFAVPVQPETGRPRLGRRRHVSPWDGPRRRLRGRKKAARERRGQ